MKTEYGPGKFAFLERFTPAQDEVSELGAEGASCPVRRTLMERLQNLESGDSRKSWLEATS